MPLKITFSNPRAKAEFADWPSGRERVKCEFYVEHTKRGYRVCRRTQDKHGRWCKPKATTFSGLAAIVDGSDGKTYILQVAGVYGFVSIYRHDFMCATEEAGETSVFDRDPEYKALIDLIAAGQDIGVLTQTAS